tara:strand:+ start:2382 stop:2570 length:189 start_codon:yes stop_codon:yes gene_type:complete
MCFSLYNLEVPVLFEITMLLDVEPEANFIASDSLKKSLEEIIRDTIYDLDDVKIIEIDAKEK